MILKVKKIKLETENSFSLILEKPKRFNFYPGQYLDIELPVNDPNSSTRAFTISSSPTENYLTVTTKKGITPFKKFVENIKPGDTVFASHPAGTFVLDETESAVFIAGGIGITPFRSMIRYVLDQKLKTPILLIYSNSDENFPFKDELDRWPKQLPNLKVIYHISKISGRLNIDKLEKILNLKSLILNHIFYLAGPPNMVDDIEKILIETGVDPLNIRADRFDGY
ncbi:FAD-dependent oxidoreductase [Candidatus Daviesbacteria bacterium]|nr:FAD-dependent oxidoreductase [Candidatus Daviesbacteria bacterium]